MFHACTYQSRLYFIPDRMGKSIVNYVNHHIMPGSFLQAVFKNDLADAVGHADRENLCNLPAYINYLYNEAPSLAGEALKKLRDGLG